MKKIIFLTAALLALGLFLHSCKIPTQIEIKAKPELDLPVKSGSSNLTKLFSDSFKDMFSDSEISIYDFDDGVDDTQTFLIHYPIIKDMDLDLNQYFDDLNDNDFFTESQSLNQTITIPSLDDNTITETIDVLMTDVFGDIRTRINSSFAGEDIKTGTINTGASGSINDTDPIDLGDEFATATFKSGILDVTLTLSEIISGLPLTSTDLTLRNITIVNNGGELPNIVYPDPVNIAYDNRVVTFQVDLAGKTIGNELSIAMDYDDNSGGIVEAALIEVDPVLLPTPPLVLSAATGLKNINSTIVVDPTSISLADLPDEFVHAVINEGELILNVALPNSDGYTFTGLEITPDLSIYQGSSTFAAAPYNGLGWLSSITTGTTSLNGKDINKAAIVIQNPSSEVTLASDDLAGGAAFSMPPSWGGSTIPVTITTQVSISSFTQIHVDPSEVLDFSIEPISMDLTDAGRYVESIYFNAPGKIGVDINFSRVDVAGLTLNITASDSELDIPGTTPQSIAVGDIPFKNSAATTFNLKNGAGRIKGSDPIDNDAVGFEVDIASADVLVINNVTPGDEKKIEGTAEMVFDWFSAVINAGSESLFSGSFPETGDPIELSEMDEYLEGFNFTDVKAYLYVSGPNAFNPILDMKSVDGGGTESPFINEALTLLSAPVVVNADEDGNYIGNSVPPGGVLIDDELQDLLNNRSALRFKYDINLGATTIYRTDLDNTLDKMNGDLLILVPLKFQAVPAGANIVFPDMFEAGKDILGRDEINGDSMFDMLDGLVLEIVLNKEDVFNGGTMYISDILPGFVLGGRGMRVEITSRDMDRVKKEFLIPNVRIEFAGGSVLKLPRDLGATEISFSADIDYKIEF
jgi:hypothetical protein